MQIKQAVWTGGVRVWVTRYFHSSGTQVGNGLVYDIDRREGRVSVLAGAVVPWVTIFYFLHSLSVEQPK